MPLRSPRGRSLLETGLRIEERVRETVSYDEIDVVTCALVSPTLKLGTED